MKSHSDILVLADDPLQRDVLARILGRDVGLTEDPDNGEVAIVVEDFALLDRARAAYPLRPVIMIGSEDGARPAAQALKRGAFDYLAFSDSLAADLPPVLYEARQQAAGLIQSEAAEQLTLLEALHDSAAALTSTLDLEEVLDRILANLARVVPYDTGTVMLVDGAQARMVRNRRSSQPEQQIDQPMVEFDIDDMPTLRQMRDQRQPIHISDTQRYAGWVPLAQSAWVRSFAGAPIIEDDQVIGFLTLNSASAGAFKANHAERLQTFSNHAGIAIRNARLFDTAQRYAAELEQRVQERTAELNLERKQLHAILESTGEGIVYTAGDAIQYVNQAMTTLTGYEAEALIDQPITLLAPDGTLAVLWRSILARIEQGTPIWRGEVQITRCDGSIFDAGLTVARSAAPGAGVLHTVTVVRDISQEKALEDQKARFIATASHELRTPITNMRTRLYLIQHQPERMDDHTRVMEEVVLRMQKLVEDLLDQSRFDRGLISLELEKVALQGLVQDVLNTQQAEAQTRGITLSAEMADRDLYVMGDRARLEQVLTNLVTNGLHYTLEGGQVTIRLADGEQACIQVIDTGIGISPEYLTQIFEPFVRANDRVKGTGLGLSIARQIVDMHGGEISVESTPGAGSCFTVLLKHLDEQP